jgi:hypothetical protein
MTIILYLLAGIAAIVLLVLMIALVVKKGYSVNREVIIDKPAPEVFNYVRLLKNQDHYSKFVMMDLNMQKAFRGVDGTEGFVYAWNGNKQAGEGEHEIKRIVDGRQIDTEVRFIRPFAGVGYTTMSTESVQDGQTKVRWSFTSEMAYPMNIMLQIMNIEKLLGKDLEVSLDNLKRHLEK